MLRVRKKIKKLGIKFKKHQERIKERRKQSSLKENKYISEDGDGVFQELLLHKNSCTLTEQSNPQSMLLPELL